ncbi:hypothetical protein CBL_03506 [Carabus blaptoides fortunei]
MLLPDTVESVACDDCVLGDVTSYRFTKHSTGTAASDSEHGVTGTVDNRIIHRLADRQQAQYTSTLAPPSKQHNKSVVQFIINNGRTSCYRCSCCGNVRQRK